jgi:hypothetical protein
MAAPGRLTTGAVQARLGGMRARVSAETACEFLHKALPRKRYGCAAWARALQAGALSAADEGSRSESADA